MKTLKLLNSPLTVLYFIWCTALMVACWDTPTEIFTQISVRFQQFQAKGGVALAMSPLLALIVTGLLPPSIKAVLVFWRTSDVLPGHRAFSVHAEKDVRVNSTALRRFISPWPATAGEQNQAWYALSKQHADAPAVADGHRMFLLWRDITACSAVFGVIGTAVLLAFGTSTFWSIGFALIQAVQFVLASVLGRVHGERFVCNVLAEATANAPVQENPKIIVAT